MVLHSEFVCNSLLRKSAFIHIKALLHFAVLPEHFQNHLPDRNPVSSLKEITYSLCRCSGHTRGKIR